MTTFTAHYDYSGANLDTATFRRLISDYRSLLTGSGLVKVPVTGEIDVETVAFPAAINTVAGFDIFRFDDALHASAPIFMKIEYGRGGSSGVFGVWVALGTVVSSSGALGGAQSERLGMHSYQDNVATGVSFSCHTDGFFGVMNRPGGISGNSYGGTGTFAVCRSCDSNGYPTGDGAYLIASNGATARAQSIRFSGAAGAVSAVSSAIFSFPLGVSGSIGGEVPFYPLWMPLPELIPVFGLVAYPDQLVSVIDLAEVAVVGSRVRRYIFAPQSFTGRSSNPSFGMLWE